MKIIFAIVFASFVFANDEAPFIEMKLPGIKKGIHGVSHRYERIFTSKRNDEKHFVDGPMVIEVKNQSEYPVTVNLYTFHKKDASFTVPPKTRYVDNLELSIPDATAVHISCLRKREGSKRWHSRLSKKGLPKIKGPLATVKIYAKSSIDRDY